MSYMRYIWARPPKIYIINLLLSFTSSPKIHKTRTIGALCVYKILTRKKFFYSSAFPFAFRNGKNPQTMILKHIDIHCIHVYFFFNSTMIRTQRPDWILSFSLKPSTFKCTPSSGALFNFLVESLVLENTVVRFNIYSSAAYMKNKKFVYIRY